METDAASQLPVDCHCTTDSKLLDKLKSVSKMLQYKGKYFKYVAVIRNIGDIQHDISYVK